MKETSTEHQLNFVFDSADSFSLVTGVVELSVHRFVPIPFQRRSRIVGRGRGRGGAEMIGTGVELCWSVRLCSWSNWTRRREHRRPRRDCC